MTIAIVKKKSISLRSCFSKYELETTYGCEAWYVVVHVKNLDIYCSEVHIWNRSLITCHYNKLRKDKGIKSRGVVIVVTCKHSVDDLND